MLLADLPSEKKQLEQAWRVGDLTGLQEISHRLLGATRYTGVPALRACLEVFYPVCLDLAGQVAPSSHWQQVLEEAFEQVLQAIEAVLANEKQQS